MQNQKNVPPRFYRRMHKFVELNLKKFYDIQISKISSVIFKMSIKTAHSKVKGK